MKLLWLFLDNVTQSEIRFLSHGMCDPQLLEPGQVGMEKTCALSLADYIAIQKASEMYKSRTDRDFFIRVSIFRLGLVRNWTSADADGSYPSLPADQFRIPTPGYDVFCVPDLDATRPVSDLLDFLGITSSPEQCNSMVVRSGGTCRDAQLKYVIETVPRILEQCNLFSSLLDKVVPPLTPQQQQRRLCLEAIAFGCSYFDSNVFDLHDPRTSLSTPFREWLLREIPQCEGLPEPFLKTNMLRMVRECKLTLQPYVEGHSVVTAAQIFSNFVAAEIHETSKTGLEIAKAWHFAVNHLQPVYPDQFPQPTTSEHIDETAKRVTRGLIEWCRGHSGAVEAALAVPTQQGLDPQQHYATHFSLSWLKNILEERLDPGLSFVPLRTVKQGTKIFECLNKALKADDQDQDQDRRSHVLQWQLLQSSNYLPSKIIEFDAHMNGDSCRVKTKVFYGNSDQHPDANAPQSPNQLPMCVLRVGQCVQLLAPKALAPVLANCKWRAVDTGLKERAARLTSSGIDSAHQLLVVLNSFLSQSSSHEATDGHLSAHLHSDGGELDLPVPEHDSGHVTDGKKRTRHAEPLPESPAGKSQRTMAPASETEDREMTDVPEAVASSSDIESDDAVVSPKVVVKEKLDQSTVQLVGGAQFLGQRQPIPGKAGINLHEQFDESTSAAVLAVPPAAMGSSPLPKWQSRSQASAFPLPPAVTRPPGYQPRAHGRLVYSASGSPFAVSSHNLTPKMFRIVVNQVLLARHKQGDRGRLSSSVFKISGTRFVWSVSFVFERRACGLH